MNRPEIMERLERAGIRPSAQRVVVAEYVLQTDEHPTADRVWSRVRTRMPVLSRATVYNTLNLFVAKGLLRMLVLSEGSVVFDPRIERHHHFIDDETGSIHDVPWAAVKVAKVEEIPGYDVREWQVVMRGRRSKPQKTQKRGKNDG